MLRSFQLNSFVHRYYTRNCDIIRLGQYSFHNTKSSFVEIGKKLNNLLPDYFKHFKYNVFKLQM